jgi:hypothetical protein
MTHQFRDDGNNTETKCKVIERDNNKKQAQQLLKEEQVITL